MIKFDEFGPEKIIQVYNPKVGMRGILILDNTILGPGKGGIRLQPDITTEEIFKLARTMTWKNALMELPFGGAKGGIIADHKTVDKIKMIKAYTKAIKQFVPQLYVAAPDMGTGSEEMSAFAKEIGTKKACTGKPEKEGGIPHELGSTGFGVAESTEVAASQIKLNLKNSSIAIEGFGEVGTWASHFLNKKGAKIVAISDSKGTIYNKNGLDIEKLKKIKEETGAVKNYKDGTILNNKELFKLNVDILIPGAKPDVITEKNVNDIKSKIIVEAANIPMSFEIEKILHKKGILVVPDFVANAGGVVSSYVEFTEGSAEEMFNLVKEKIRKNTKLVLEKAEQEKITPREAALKIAKERVKKAMV